MGVKVSTNKNIELTKGEERVLEAIKKAYSTTEHEVVIYVQSTIANKRPDFIIIDSIYGISILEVKDWSEDYIRDVNKRRVKLLDNECDSPNIQVKGYKTILYSGIITRDFNISEEDISTVVVFTNMNNTIKNDNRYADLFTNSVKYLFKADISSINVSGLFNEGCYGLSEEDFKKIRVALFPELEIVNMDNQQEDIEVIKVLDYEQEEFAKKVPIGHYMVTGIPGSGKTVILLARAIHLIKENPDWKILILTYNKSLSYKLKSKLDKFAEIFKNDINNKDVNLDNIEVRHFHKETSILTNGARKPRDMDSTLWFEKVVVERATKNARPLYDAVLIDEYQDFYMDWIKLCLLLCKEYEDKNGKSLKNIFLAGDRLQSIYNNKDVSWSSIGINMQGRSKLLKTSYRSAKQHMALALDFLKLDDKLRAEVDKFYKDDSEDSTLNSVNDGSLEFMLGNYKCIGDKILALKKDGYKNEDFLVISNSQYSCNTIIDNSPTSLKYQMKFVKDIDSVDFQDNIIVTTYHSSKGLEAKVVFLTNLDSIYNGNDIGNQLKRKTVYVGITRASEKLFIHSAVNTREGIVNELSELANRMV